jgi:hypothetical protein
MYLKLISGGAVPGWASITIITSFFGAMNALGIAVLSEYISRIYDQVRRRPEFVIAKSTNIRDESVTEAIAATSIENTVLAELNSLRLEIERLQGSRESTPRSLTGVMNSEPMALATGSPRASATTAPDRTPLLAPPEASAYGSG